MKMNFALYNKICDFLALTENCSYFAGHIQYTYIYSTEMEFLDINLTKDLSLLPNAIHSSFYLLILKKTYFSLVLKSFTKIRETRKLESTGIHEKHFV
jgi:hypothetical protein